MGVSRKTAAYYFRRFCTIITHALEARSGELFTGEIKVDESDFGGRRKGKRGRGAVGKIPVFLVYLSVVGGSIPRSFPTRLGQV